MIYVYWGDHGPPHFHAVYGDYEVLIVIDDLSILQGGLAPRAMRLVREWAVLHQRELREVWRQAQNLEALSTIEPLK